MTYLLTSDSAAHARGLNHPSFMTRITNALKRKIADGIAQYRLNRKARLDRAAFNQMLLLDNELLDDIGVTRANVEWASQLPTHQSAAQALDATKKRARPRIRP